MSQFCEHETFKDICGICNRDTLITALRADNERLRAALGQIGRMKLVPDDVMNRITLLAAIQIARAASDCEQAGSRQ